MSLFPRPEPGVNAAALMRRKMNLVVLLFIVSKGAAAYQGLSWRLYLEVSNSPMWTHRCSFFFMSLIFHTDGVNLLCANPGVSRFGGVSPRVEA